MKTQTLSHEEWLTRYTKLRRIADRIARMRNDRARRACREAGLDPNLLGIHPHNAMCAYQARKPWREVDDSKVRLCLRILACEFEGREIVRRWDARVRGF